MPARSSATAESGRRTRPIRTSSKGPDWKADVINPPSKFLSDVAGGRLAAITWISPTFETSDHPGMDETQGPAWVASVVNAIGQSQFWDSTAIFISGTIGADSSIRWRRRTQITTAWVFAFRC